MFPALKATFGGVQDARLFVIRNEKRFAENLARFYWTILTT
jgi:hypothetical protein